MTVPWQTQARTPFDKLVDIFILGPNILRKAKDLGSWPPDQLLPGAVAIVNDLSGIIHKLQLFYCDLEETSGRPLYWEQASPKPMNGINSRVDDGDAVLVFPPTLSFQNPGMALVLSLYWSMLTMVWSGLADLYPLFIQHGAVEVFTNALDHGQQVSPESMQFLWLDRARKVFQSVAFCTTAKSLESGPPRISTALNIVIDTIKNRKEGAAEYAWAVRARKEIGERWVRLLEYQA